jgi:hypothetical protein
MPWVAWKESLLRTDRGGPRSVFSGQEHRGHASGCAVGDLLAWGHRVFPRMEREQNEEHTMAHCRSVVLHCSHKRSR